MSTTGGTDGLRDSCSSSGGFRPSPRIFPYVLGALLSSSPFFQLPPLLLSPRPSSRRRMLTPGLSPRGVCPREKESPRWMTAWKRPPRGRACERSVGRAARRPSPSLAASGEREGLPVRLPSTHVPTHSSICAPTTPPPSAPLPRRPLPARSSPLPQAATRSQRDAGHPARLLGALHPLCDASTPRRARSQGHGNCQEDSPRPRRPSWHLGASAARRRNPAPPGSQHAPVQAPLPRSLEAAHPSSAACGVSG